MDEHHQRVQACIKETGRTSLKNLRLRKSFSPRRSARAPVSFAIAPSRWILLLSQPHQLAIPSQQKAALTASG